MADYIFPNFVIKLLKKPSMRTQLEAGLIGITMVMLTSISTSIYFIFFTEMSIFFKILSGIGGLGIFILMFSYLSTNYIQYYIFKKNMGLYKPDEELKMKVEEAKDLIKELNILVDKNGEGGAKC